MKEKTHKEREKEMHQICVFSALIVSLLSLLSEVAKGMTLMCERRWREPYNKFTAP